jgi:hypothetical protein
MSDLRNDDQAPKEDMAKGAFEAASDVSEAAGQGATSLMSQVKEQAASTLSDQKDGIADRIDALADTVHQSGAQFEGQQDWLASAIDRGATELGSLATALRDNDLAGLFRQVQTVARRQPALFIGASLAAGFAAARLGKLVTADISRADLPTLGGDDHAQA